jgi:hypothetical protein
VRVRVAAVEMVVWAGVADGAMVVVGKEGGAMVVAAPVVVAVPAGVVVEVATGVMVVLAGVGLVPAVLLETLVLAGLGLLAPEAALVLLVGVLAEPCTVLHKMPHSLCRPSPRPVHRTALHWPPHTSLAL